MISTGLPVSRYVQVSVSLTTPGIIAESVNTCLLLGTSNVIDTTERMRRYTDINEVASDFLTTSEEFLGAEIWFSQNPRPSQLFIGRWAKTSTAGKLNGAILTPTEQLMSAWTTVVAGGFNVTIDGTAVPITGLSFASQTNLNGVASVITTALATHGSMVWDQEQDRFELRSATTGITSSVSFLTAGTGTDISAQLKMTATSSGAYAVTGMAPETALSAVTLIDQMYSSQWYAIVVPSAVNNDHEQIAAYCEASDPPHYYGVTTNDTGVMSNVTQTDIAYILSNFGYNKSAVQYCSSNLYAIMSYLGRILTTAWGGQNTTITLMYKQEPGIAPEPLTTQQADAIKSKHANVYTSVSNGARMIQDGMSCSGEFTDTIIGADALALDIQAALFNVLYTTPTKIPQTDPGMALLINATSAVCSKYVENDFLAPGTWNAPGFGNITEGSLLPMGFYVWAPSLLLQDEAERAARIAPLIQVAAKCAGAFHYASVLIFINQ